MYQCPHTGDWNYRQLAKDHQGLVEFALCVFSARSVKDHALKNFNYSGYGFLRQRIASFLLPHDSVTLEWKPLRWNKQKSST